MRSCPRTIGFIAIIFVLSISSCVSTGIKFEDKGCYREQNWPEPVMVNRKWINDDLMVEIKVNLNCAVVARNPSFKISEDTLELRYKTHSSSGFFTSCTCPHILNYTIHDLNQKEYTIVVVQDGYTQGRDTP